MQAYAVFLLFVAISVYAQALTGFALALILLGLIGATEVVPLPDAVNAVTVMVLINACTFLYRRRGLHLDRSLWSALVTSMLGTVIGIAMLTWLVGASYQALRLVLGASIVLCALLLWRAGEPLARTSSHSAFISTGVMSGVLGGMFSAPGPPLVYIVYRQPWSLERMQESLIFLFGAGALLRLLIVVFFGQFTHQSVHLSLIAAPVVVLVTWIAAKQKSPFPTHIMKRIVSIFLVASGIIMSVAAARLLAQ